jgi:circadian clock protein KaiC
MPDGQEASASTREMRSLRSFFEGEMSVPIKMAQMVSTGSEGLDAVLMGGFLARGFYLVQGDPGSGKTTLALQFLRKQRSAGARCLYISLTESLVDLQNACRAHGWSLEGIELCDLTRANTNLETTRESVFHPVDTELSEIMKTVLAEVKRVDPACVVFDGLSELRLLSGDSLRYRRQLLSLKEFFANRKATVLLLDDRSASFNDVQPESLVGGNIVLDRFMPSYGRARRRLFVTKVRGSYFREGYHDYEIVTGGVLVHPRLVAGEHHAEFTPELCGTGLANLDKMLHGGLHMGSTTLLLGPAGAGKSTLSIQFVVHALRQGKKAAIYVFDEVMHTLIERSEKLCFGKPGGFRSYVTEGRLHAQQVDPAEMSPGAFAHEVRRAVDEGARVIIIDSLNGYLNAMPEERFLSTHLHELFAYLNQKGVLTIIVVAQHGMIASPIGHAEMDVSYLADSVLLLRYFEANGEIRQAISVFKKRTGPHERTIRQLSIDATGVSIGEPLHQFRGIMTGVPQYQGGNVGAPSGADALNPRREP